ncbi:MAG: hypothetical protein V4726_04855 [Verrucomicrobiota bacterium]
MSADKNHRHLNNNTFRVADLEFTVSGRMYGYISAAGVEWCVEVISEEDEPFAANLFAYPFKELGDLNFSIVQPEFFYEIKGSDNFAFNAGGEPSFIDALDVTLSRKPGMSVTKMHLWAQGKMDAMADPQYMYELDGELSVDLTFDYFQYPDSISVEQDTRRIRQITGISAPLKFLGEGSGPTALYSFE